MIPEIKILRIDDFDDDRKARGENEQRLHFPHLVIYKIVAGKKADYYYRYLDHAVAHRSPAEIEKWLRKHLHDEINVRLDQVELA